MLFVVAGPLGLPLVWKHPRWSGRVKLAVTAAAMLYALWLVTLTMRLAHTMLQAVTSLDAAAPGPSAVARPPPAAAAFSSGP